MKHLLAVALYLLATGAAAQVCRVDAGAIALGVYDPAQPRPRVVRGDVAVVCRSVAADSRLSVRVSLPGAAVRELQGRGAVLRYSLFQDSALMRSWYAAAAIVSLDPASGETRVPIYARIAPGQWVAPGNYADQVELVVEF
jgi:spore coat protein U-like protein